MSSSIAISRTEPGSVGAVKAVSVVSTGTVRIHPEHPYGTRKPLYWWLLTSQRWTPPRPINAYVIEHANGLILFDTGQDRASVIDDTYFPSGLTGYLYDRLARFDIGEQDTLTAQLATLGYTPSDVSTAILSHLHQDHIGGLAELTGSDLLVSAAEWAELAKPAPELRGFLRDPHSAARTHMAPGQPGATRQAYELDLWQFASWCHQHQLHLFAARRADIEFFARDLEARGRARATITRRLCTIAGFYRYAVEEELLDHSPAAHVRWPRLDYESHAVGLDRNELGALLVAAGLGPPAEHALISLLALNGLRVSEATSADIQALGIERGHRTLVITRKGGKVVTIPLAPCTARAIDLAIGERTEGPIFLAADGRRLDRHGAGRIVRRIARRAEITKNVGPHTLRHAFITAALDAGVPLRDVQEAASHADPRTTMRYDRARASLDRHATYIVAAYIAGAAR